MLHGSIEYTKLATSSQGLGMGSVIVFTGGGSGGHVFPGLAVLEELKKKWSGEFLWIGSARGIERGIVEKWGVPYRAIPSGKLRRELSIRNVFDAFRVVGGIFAAFFLLRRIRPVALFSKGGYVSVPPVIAARMCRIPVVTHESDADPGLATRINARFASVIFVAYDETRNYFPEGLRSRIQVSGNPVRPDIFSGDRLKGRRMIGAPEGKLVLLVLGGSQGAAQVNRLVEGALSGLVERFVVVHQTGQRKEGATAPVPGSYFPVDFMQDEYSDILAAADLVLCRAGAGTLWELALTGKPSILVPLEGATRGDQVRNAELFAARGAAYVLSESGLGDACGAPRADVLLAKAVELAGDSGLRARMANAAQTIGRAGAAMTIADTVADLANGRTTELKAVT